MQRNKSQHNQTLKESFENIIILRRNLINTLKDSTRHKTKAIIALNTRENKDYPKPEYGHGLSSVKTPLESLFLTKLSFKNVEGGSGSLRAYQKVGMGVRMGRWDGLFIGKVCHQLFNRAADVRQP